jgi:hypothetical protein
LRSEETLDSRLDEDAEKAAWFGGPFEFDGSLGVGGGDGFVIDPENQVVARLKGGRTLGGQDEAHGGLSGGGLDEIEFE